VLTILLVLFLLILPERTVKDESVFFAMILIIIVLLGIAIVLRRNKQ
jgi:hypothetical protein